LATTEEEVEEYIHALHSLGEGKGDAFVDAFLSDNWNEHLSRWVSGQEALDKAEDEDKENRAGPSGL
jgi:hypothetical protein